MSETTTTLDLEAVRRRLAVSCQGIGDAAAVVRAVPFTPGERDAIVAALERAERVAAAIKAADARRDPRHRVSMLANDWQAIVSALFEAPA